MTPIGHELPKLRMQLGVGSLAEAAAGDADASKMATAKAAQTLQQVLVGCWGRGRRRIAQRRSTEVQPAAASQEVVELGGSRPRADRR